MAIELGLGVQQHIGFARLRQHGRRIEAARSRHGLGQIATYAVGCLAEKAEACAEQRRQFLRQQAQLCRLRVLRCQIAEENACVRARGEARCNVVRIRADFDSGERGWHRPLFRLGHRLHHLRQNLRQFLRRHDRLVGERQQQIVIGGMDQINLLAALARLAQTVGDKRMVLAQEGADDEHAVEAADVGDFHAQPGCARLLRIGGKIRLAQAEIDVLAAATAHQLAQQVQLFQRGVRRGERADRMPAVLRLDIPQALGDRGQRLLPVHFLPLPFDLEHGLGQAVVRIQSLIGEAVAIGQPAFVQFLMFQRQHPHDLVRHHLHDQVGAEAVVRAHRFSAREFPGAGAVAKRLAGERAHRAQIDHVAGKFGIDRASDEGHDFRVLAAPHHAEFHHAGDLLAEAHAAGAVDAAAHLFHRDQRADALVEYHALLFLVARGARSVAHREVLQLAFAALVANRAVERVVDQQEFHHRLLRGPGVLGFGKHLHAVGDRRGAGRQGLGRLLHLHQAHAAIGGDRELLVIAEVRNGDAERVGRVHHRGAALHLDLPAVYFYCWHIVLRQPSRRRQQQR